MKYNSQVQRAEDVRTRTAMRAIADLAGWSLESLICIAPTGSRDWLYERQRELVLVPLKAGQSAAHIERSVRALRVDALLVQGVPNRSDPPFRVAFAQWSAGGMQWMGTCRFWLSGAQRLWLAADQGSDRWGPWLDLPPPRLRPSTAAPWRSTSDRDAGFARADAMIARLAEETPA